MIKFFSNWELWQQMTFVLAAAIVVVFCIGLIKLWWLSRFLKKHTVLDLEKRARQLEMQKSGLPAGKRVDIPFGVRAIQSGIEVDGIWISRPGTPIEVGQISPSIASSLTLEAGSKLKGKEKELVTHATTTVTEVEPTPDQSPQPSPTLSASGRHIPPGADRTRVKSYPLGAQPTYRPKGPSRRRTDLLADETPDVDTLDRLERTQTRQRQVETYVPTNSFSSTESSSMSSQQRTMVERSSTSSDDIAKGSTTRYVSHLRHSTLPQTLNSYEDPETSASNVNYSSGVYAEQRRNPFETPSPAESQPVSRPPLAANRPTPHRSYSGESHANTQSRKVNAGFEILPAGTFGRSNSQNDMDAEHPRRHSHNKIQKKRDRSSKDGADTR
ncbi:hypothetical protein F4776DRAFT_578437 [Hypoxylon sp. NC0597]|nr:hypothetical protein F4776DRAFT_578437 [Hypoxylon sp. NC0597]